MIAQPADLLRQWSAIATLEQCQPLLRTLPLRQIILLFRRRNQRPPALLFL